MSKEFESLVRSQHELYGRIARSYDNLKKQDSANITLGLVEARLQNLDANWAKFEAQHEKLSAHFWDDLADLDYRKRDVPTLAEDTYVLQKGMFLETRALLKSKAEAKETSIVTAEQSRSPRTTLPRIQLPQFSGKYEEWPSFRDLFHSIIGKDSCITQVEKLHYLKACLKGEAEMLIRNLPTTDENFGRAWKSLTDFYENKRLLVSSYITRFTALQKLKGESASDLRKLYHSAMSTVGALESIGRSITRGENLFVHLLVELFDPRTRREWENSLSESTEPPSYTELQQFLERRLHMLESLQASKVESNLSKSKSTATHQTRALPNHKTETKRNRCSICHKDHFVMFCDAYQAKTAAERRKHVEANNLCINCLGRHKLSDCLSKKSCSACNSRHHTTLHDAFPSGEASKTSHVAHRPSKQPGPVLLATARVRVADRFGNYHSVRALVDQGSESSLVAESLAQRLKLARSAISVSIFGVGGKLTGIARGLVDLKVAAMSGGPSLSVSALILPRLTTYDGVSRAELREWRHLDGLELADPNFLETDPVELLLGVDVHAKILQQGLRQGGPQEPIAQQTKLGWILSGSIGGTCSAHITTHQCHVDDELYGLVRRF